MHKIPTTAQEYYNLLVHCAYDGTFPSVGTGDNSVTCRYRADMTAHCPRQCGAGLLLPDEKYNPMMEGRGATAEEVCYHLCLPVRISLTDVNEIQSAHDITARQPPWDAAEFVSRLNELPCFDSVDKVVPDLEPSKDSLHPQGL